jgi:hypothetical protein
MLVLIDTNILISAALFPDSIPAHNVNNRLSCPILRYEKAVFVNGPLTEEQDD